MSAKRKTIKATALALALLACGIVSEVREAGAREGANRTLEVIGLTDDGRLVSFKTRTPERTKEIGVVTGLVSDTSLVGIDFRVQDGLLYGVGNGGGVYTIDTNTAVASLVNSLSVALAGVSFGVDFNPAADRLRIISDAGQNLRHNVNPGGMTLADGTLTYTAPPTAPVTALGVTGAAYTNNDLNPNTATTLFDIDTAMDQGVIQSPANSGILVATGKLGVDVDSLSGFDIYSQLVSGVTVRNRGFAALIVDGTARFYRIDLLTGQATLVGDFAEPVIDIAIPLDQ